MSDQRFGVDPTRKPRLNLLRLEEDLSQAHLRLAGVCIEHLPWQEVIRKYDRPHTLFYLDPPYWQTEGYGMEFGLGEYALMGELARTIQGAMIISINDHPEVLEHFGGLHKKIVQISYTVGGGSGSKAREAVIWNNNCGRGRVAPSRKG